MNILQPHCHVRFTESLIILCERLGHHLYLLDDSWKNQVRYDFTWPDHMRGLPWVLDSPNVHMISYEEFCDTDLIDVVIISCHENQYDCLANIWGVKGDKCKYMTYYGNDYMEGMLPFEVIQNHMSADINSHHAAVEAGVNSFVIKPPIDYDLFCFKTIDEESEPSINTYIHFYKETWVRSYRIFSQFREDAERELGIKFREFGRTGKDGEIKSPKDVPAVIHDSWLTSHIKEREGYGYGCIESMACGRPVIAYRPYVKPRAMSEWVNEDLALLFDTPQELMTKLNYYVKNKDFRKEMQASVAAEIRKMIDPGKEAEKFGKFLEELR